MKLTLRTKILAATTAITLAVMAATAVLLPGVFRSQRYSELERNLASEARLLQHTYAYVYRTDADPQEMARVTKALSFSFKKPVKIVRSDEVVIVSSDGKTGLLTDPIERYNVQQALALNEDRGHGYVPSLDGSVLSVTLPLVRKDEGSLVLEVSTAVPGVESEVWTDTRRVLLFIGLLSLAVMALQFVMITGAIWPLRWMTQTARMISKGELHHRIRIPHSGEVGELASAFNQMVHSMEERIGHLWENDSTMRAAFEHMADGLVVLDPAGRVLLFNGVAEAAFGRSAVQAQGRTLLDVSLHPELGELISRTLRTGEQSSGEIQLRRPSPKVLRVYVTPVPVEEESSVGAVMVFQDLTEIRRLESVRRDFVTNASHELKTPLATIGVMVDTLKDGKAPDGETERRFLATIGTEVRRLGALIEDLLDLSRIETGHHAQDCEVLALDSLLESLVDTHRPSAERRSQTLTVELRRDTLAWADPQAVIRIAGNLIENALKYTPEGGRIEVACGVVDHEAYIEVADNGIGIPESELGRIFERFYRVDKARSRATGGTGLGLSIVKHLVEAQRGRIAVESALGRGARFTVFLPAILEDDWQEENADLRGGEVKVE